MSKIGTGLWKTFVSELDTSGTGGNMWIKTSSDNAKGYYLSSPLSSGNNNYTAFISLVSSGGSLTGASAELDRASYAYYGCRPLVAIPKSSLR